ncbi:MAG: hypothetical protein ABI474_05575 [Actinomycetota bacterium]
MSTISPYPASAGMTVTEHVGEALLLIQPPDGERERVTEQLREFYAWSEAEADPDVEATA